MANTVLFYLCDDVDSLIMKDRGVNLWCCDKLLRSYSFDASFSRFDGEIS